MEYVNLGTTGRESFASLPGHDDLWLQAKWREWVLDEEKPRSHLSDARLKRGSISSIQRICIPLVRAKKSLGGHFKKYRRLRATTWSSPPKSSTRCRMRLTIAVFRASTSWPQSTIASSVFWRGLC